MDATSFAGTFMISNRRRENSTSSSGASGSSMSGTSYGSSGSSYGSTPSSSGSYFPQSNKGSQNGFGDNRKLSNKCNSSTPFQNQPDINSEGAFTALGWPAVAYQRNNHYTPQFQKCSFIKTIMDFLHTKIPENFTSRRVSITIT